MKISKMVRVYQVLERNGKTPVRIRSWEDEPRHADMLRYDLAFCDPEDVSRVIFPVFKDRNGTTQKTMTLARWDSFSTCLQEFLPEVNGPLGKWFTYTRHAQNHELVKQTLDEFTAKHPKMPIVGWR